VLENGKELVLIKGKIQDRRYYLRYTPGNVGYGDGALYQRQKNGKWKESEKKYYMWSLI